MDRDRKKNAGKRLFVLDTNVLMHDPTALYRFKEHDVFLPMVVLEELDHGKKGMSEVARNVRQVSRFLDELVSGLSEAQIMQGIPLPALTNDNGMASERPSGHLLFQTEELPNQLPASLPGNRPDNSILATAHTLQNKYPDVLVTLVSKDINLRIKASILGVHAEDYFNDKVLDDVELLYSGTFELPTNFWETHGKALESWQESGHTFYKVAGPLTQYWYPNQCLYSTSEDEPFEAIVRQVTPQHAVIELVKDYRNPNHSIWGIKALNREQNLALNLLMDPNIDLVTICGTAGTGKTLLTLAAGLTQALEQNRYREIIMTRVTIPVGEDIGFLPGTEEEKMTPWMGALMDNLEVLNNSEVGGNWGRAATNDLIRNRIKIRSLNFMRGRTFLNKFIILDEAQNLTSKQMRTLITRAGPGTKMVCLGNLSQIDTPYLTETSSGLTFVVERFKNWEYGAHITLTRGERSRLADFASSQGF